MHEFRQAVSDHVTSKMQAKRLQYLNEQFRGYKPIHERLSDPKFMTGIYRKRFEDFGPNNDFRTAMERRIASREREMKSSFTTTLRLNREDIPRNARRPPKRYDEAMREHFRSTTLGASSFLRQAAQVDDEQDLSPVSNRGSKNRRGLHLPQLRGKSGKRHRHHKKGKTSHNIHGMFEVTKRKNYKEKQEKLLRTLARFKKIPKGTV